MQGNPRSARGPCICAGASVSGIPSHRVQPTGYCATVINGAVHSKYTEEKSADSFCESDSGKNNCQPRFQLSACEEVLRGVGRNLEKGGR